MSLTFDKEALKELASLKIESDCIHKLAVEIFNNVGNSTGPYQELCQELNASLDKIIGHATEIKKAIPQK